MGARPGRARSDADLVARCRAGDERAWGELVERYSSYVYALVTRVYALSPHDAEDVFQETFARTYERLGELRDDAALRPWLRKIAVRLALDRLRVGARERPHESAADELPGADPTDELDQALAVREALDALPERCQEILEHFFVRDESYRSIAEALDVPSGTIASRISRCLTRLREEIAGTPSAPE